MVCSMFRWPSKILHKNILAQKHTFKKQTDSSWWFQPAFRNKQILVGGFNPSQKYAQVTLDHFVMDRGESSKNVWNYHPDFHAKPHDPQKFGETEVTKSRRPVSQGTWHKQLHYSWEVNASDLFLNVFWSRCFLGGQNFSVIDCKSIWLYLLKVLSPHVFCSKGMRLPCSNSWDLQNSRKWKSRLWTNHLFPKFSYYTSWWKALGQFPSCQFHCFYL